ncbi:MAG: hypothetical protein SGJ27_04795 [Candidatus Melainabacteria bacterium]|nr:hypothetical protein [Candidatus Melainabacteria bacterium]
MKKKAFSKQFGSEKFCLEKSNSEKSRSDRSRSWAKVMSLAAALSIAGFIVQPADAVTKAHIFDSAKHTRIYFSAGAEAFADEAVEYKVGKKKPPHLWETPDPALGTPNFRDHEGDRLARKPSFAALGAGGSITLRFTDNSVIDFPGPDLYVFEPLENQSPIKVEVSRDGKFWIDLGADLRTASEIDIAGKGGKNAIYNFVRITDLSDVDPADQWPGADIDAVGALNSASKISILDQSLCPELTGKKKGATEGGDTKAVNIDADLKRVADHYSSVNPKKLVVEVYSDSHPEGKTDSTTAVQSAPTTSESKNPHAKARSEAVKAYLLGAGKLPKDRVEIDFFDDARSMARREVEKEHERNNRFDFILIPYDRDTVIGDKGTLKVDQAVVLMDGKWESDQGEVIFIPLKDPNSKNVLLTGEWHESPAQKGTIQSGTYDPKTQQLTIAYVKTWSNQKGTAELKLSYDSVRLKGPWKADTGATGQWTLIRKGW